MREGEGVVEQVELPRENSFESLRRCEGIIRRLRRAAESEESVYSGREEYEEAEKC
jgi:hypothetical protein